MSLMLKKSVKDFGDWYLSPLATGGGARSLFYGKYRPVIMFRMATIVVTGFFSGIGVIAWAPDTFQAVYRRM
jgi:hypothetical protein